MKEEFLQCKMPFREIGCPTLSGAFIDPKYSQIDIIQAVGKVIRKVIINQGTIIPRISQKKKV